MDEQLSRAINETKHALSNLAVACDNDPGIDDYFARLMIEDAAKAVTRIQQHYGKPLIDSLS